MQLFKLPTTYEISYRVRHIVTTALPMDTPDINLKRKQPEIAGARSN